MIVGLEHAFLLARPARVYVSAQPRFVVVHVHVGFIVQMDFFFLLVLTRSLSLRTKRTRPEAVPN